MLLAYPVTAVIRLQVGQICRTTRHLQQNADTSVSYQHDYCHAVELSLMSVSGLGTSALVQPSWRVNPRHTGPYSTRPITALLVVTLRCNTM